MVRLFIRLWKWNQSFQSNTVRERLCNLINYNRYTVALVFIVKILCDQKHQQKRAFHTQIKHVRGCPPCPLILLDFSYLAFPSCNCVPYQATTPMEPDNEALLRKATPVQRCDQVVSIEGKPLPKLRDIGNNCPQAPKGRAAQRIYFKCEARTPLKGT